MKVYQYNEEELTLIKGFDQINHNFWSIKKNELAPLRKNLRVHYVPLQNYRCCYCKMLKQEIHGSTWDIEHIVPKALYPHFMFEHLNLCISCKTCNNYKLESNVFVNNKKYKVYPKSSKTYKIIHPHFDKYSDHMEVKIHPNGHITHNAKTQKGVETFKSCNLFRFTLLANGSESLDMDLYNKFSNLIGNSDKVSADTAKAFFKASLAQILPPEEINC
ncbi:hypothetical protein Q7574_11650 [Acinetobacter pittii]|uniref:HNH endonuclease n=1 Tax=Acinetobacter pittii TaxID=48296 RepID=UPI00313CC4A3